ncbi:GtrA family protein [Devosia sp.]|uniref:GtrA family protein n=1 Tax=Devosia sp. TaxID=1871048 RepID=UPI00326416CB
MNVALQSLMPDTRSEPAGRTVLEGLLLFVGIGAGAAFGFVVLSNLMLALPTGLANWLVSALCYAEFIVPVYLMHRRFSFDSSAPHYQALPRYVAVQAMALLLATAFSYLVYGMLVVPTLVASMLVIALTSGVNFIILRTWAFARV